MRFEIYFPSKDKDGKDLEPITRFSVFHTLHEKLIEDFGGYTKIPAHGMSKVNGHTVSEDIFVFVVYTDEVKETYLRKLAEQIKIELNQSSVMVTLDNRAIFV